MNNPGECNLSPEFIRTEFVAGRGNGRLARAVGRLTHFRATLLEIEDQVRGKEELTAPRAVAKGQLPLEVG